MKDSNTIFKEELDYFIEHQDSLVKKYAGKILLIKGSDVIKVYDSVLAAYQDGADRFGAGNYMIQPCVSGVDAYTISISAANSI